MLGGNLGSFLYGDVSVMSSFLMSVSVTFQLMYRLFLVRFRWLSGHLLGERAAD